MTVKEQIPDQTHSPVNYDFAAVGIVIPGTVILHPSVAGHTDEMYENNDPVNPGLSFEVTHDGVLTGMHKFANRYGILGVPNDDTATKKNAIVGVAIAQTLRVSGDFKKAFSDVVPRIKGAFSLIAAHNGELFVARDRHGLSSMFIGELPTGGYIASSQQKYLEEHNAAAQLELEPGMLARIGAKAIYATRWGYPVH